MKTNNLTAIDQEKNSLGDEFSDSDTAGENGGIESKKPSKETKLFNVRISDGCKERLRLLKEDPLLDSITWNDLLEILIVLLCQNGCVGEEGIKKIEKTGGWKGGIPREIKREFGLGARWAEIGPTVENLKEEIRHAWGVLSQVEDALYEFATAIEASEEAEANPEPELEPEENGLFKN